MNSLVAKFIKIERSDDIILLNNKIGSSFAIYLFLTKIQQKYIKYVDYSYKWGGW